MAVILNGRTSRNAVSVVEEVESRVARENATTLCLAVVEWTANTWDQVQRQEHVVNVPVVNQWSTLVGHFFDNNDDKYYYKGFRRFQWRYSSSIRQQWRCFQRGWRFVNYDIVVDDKDKDDGDLPFS